MRLQPADANPQGRKRGDAGSVRRILLKTCGPLVFIVAATDYIELVREC